jgi:hypothetical protein
MKILKKIKAHHIAAIFIIAFILSFIIGKRIIVQKREYIFKVGQTSICKVYHLHCDGEVDICDGYYFFYYQGKKYFSYYIMETHKINPVGKYYKVFFLPKDPDKNTVDYSQVINKDSVYKFFPTGKNPFEKDSAKLEAQ